MHFWSHAAAAERGGQNIFNRLLQMGDPRQRGTTAAVHAS